MKSTIVQEIGADEDVDSDEKAKTRNQRALSVNGDIGNYLSLLKALYENSSLVKGFREQSAENHDNGNPNQPQHVSAKKINISIKSEPDDEAKTVGGESRLGNIIINSLDVSINVPFADCSHGDEASVKVARKPLEETAEQLVTSSSSEPGDDDQSITTSENNNSAAHHINDEAARAVRVRPVPDDISPDYCRKTKRHDDADEDDDKHTSSTTCNNNSLKHSSGADDAGDYRRRSEAAIDVERTNKPSGDIKPITSTYLLMTRSMGLADEDALNLVSEMFDYGMRRRVGKTSFVCLSGPGSGQDWVLHV
jgi:hypothetical protein